MPWCAQRVARNACCTINWCIWAKILTWPLTWDEYNLINWLSDSKTSNFSQKISTVISTSSSGRRPSPWQFALQIHCSSSNHSWNILLNLLFTSVTVLQRPNSRWNCTQIFALLPLLSSSLLTSANQLDRQHWRTMSRGRQSALRKCSRTEPLTLPCSEIQWIALILEMLKCRNTKLNRCHKFKYYEG